MSSSSSSSRFNVIVASTQRGGIGLKGSFPWPKIKEDLKMFKEITCETSITGKKNAVIMGRKTFESMNSKPLSGRVNIVLSSTLDLKEGGLLVCKKTLQEALQYCSRDTDGIDKVFVIGGYGVYKEALALEACENVYLTQILKDYPFDTKFPPIPPTEFDLENVGDVKQEKEVHFQFLRYKRKSDPTSGLSPPTTTTQEGLYLQLVQEVLRNGKRRPDRTGVGTLSVFGRQVRYDLSKGEFPLFTTKSLFWRGIVAELLWFLQGCTDSKKLSDKKVKIWDDNGSREFLDKGGFTDRRVGDLGPIYGFQWRHFGAKYKDCDTDYSGEGVDQLKDLIALIKKDPSSRRLLMTAWNPLDLHKMTLPPCHVLVQFYVSDGVLSCQMYQRSADLGLGVPFNVASYALLTYMVAQVCELKVGEFVHTFGDLHIYLNHVEQLREQLKRTPFPLPRVVLNPEVTEIDKFSEKDIKLLDYKHHPTIKMKMN